MRIGELVKSHTGRIFDHCRENPEELARLMSKEYSKRVFAISFPFCKRVMDIRQSESRRFWTSVHDVCGETVRVTSQWPPPWLNRRVWPHFVGYLSEKAIITEQERAALLSPDLVATSAEPPKAEGGGAAKTPSRGRYRSMPAGNVQNYFVRYILGNLGEESFSGQEWEAAKAHFGGACAYCGEVKQLEMDHAVPINKEHMGEHRLGNLVPSCRQCNETKRSSDYREFLADNAAARQAIEEYMRMHGYTPIKDREDAAKMREVMEIAYREIKPLAERYIRILNSMLD